MKCARRRGVLTFRRRGRQSEANSGCDTTPAAAAAITQHTHYCNTHSPERPTPTCPPARPRQATVELRPSANSERPLLRVDARISNPFVKAGHVFKSLQPLVRPRSLHRCACVQLKLDELVPIAGHTSVNRGDRLQHDEERPASSWRQPVAAARRHPAVAQEGQTRLGVEQPSGCGR